jgi:hypothetical protein
MNTRDCRCRKKNPNVYFLNFILLLLYYFLFLISFLIRGPQIDCVKIQKNVCSTLLKNKCKTS